MNSLSFPDHTHCRWWRFLFLAHCRPRIVTYAHHPERWLTMEKAITKHTRTDSTTFI